MIASPSDLVYFVEVANTLNFSRASERIGISQPSLSIAIKRLEQHLNIDLFIRSKNGVTLTQGGKRLLTHAKQLLQLWDTVKSECHASHHEVQGSVVFGCHASVALYSLSKFLPDLLLKYPKLEIKLEHDLSRKILEGIINLSIDLGIVVNPIRHPDLIIQKLYDDKVTFWHASHAQEEVQKLYSGQGVIICDPELGQSQWLLKQLHKEGIKYQRIITSSSLEVISHLTATGCGIGILPKCVTLSAPTNSLCALPNMPSYNDEICLAYRHENRSIKALQTIIQSIKAVSDTLIQRSETPYPVL